MNFLLPTNRLAILSCLFIFLSCISFSYASEELSTEEGKVVMAVFAHPDDEMTVGSILPKYAGEGAKVYLVTVTDGRYGTGQTDSKQINKKAMVCGSQTIEQFKISVCEDTYRGT